MPSGWCQGPLPQEGRMRWQNPPYTFSFNWNRASFCTSISRASWTSSWSRRPRGQSSAEHQTSAGRYLYLLAGRESSAGSQHEMDTDNSGSTLRCPSLQPPLLLPLPLPSSLESFLPSKWGAKRDDVDSPALDPALLAPMERIAAASAACQHPSKCSVYNESL